MPAVNMSQSSGVTVQDYLFDTSMGIGWFAGSANITGLALLVILTVMVICSHRAVRKSGYFEVSPLRSGCLSGCCWVRLCFWLL